VEPASDVSKDAGQSPGGAPPRGLLHALRSIGPSLAALLRTRLELLGIEAAQERERVIGQVVLAAVGGLCAALALLMLNVLVLAWFWASNRYGAIIALLVIYVIAAAACFARLRAQARSRRPPFEATLAELKADMEALGSARRD
jgi:uncharacterized membrane protein YqjE